MIGLFGIVTLALVLGALIDIIVSPEWKVRHLPKVAWVLLVVFLPLIGSIIWFAVGHDWAATAQHMKTSAQQRPTLPHAIAPKPTGALSTEQQLEALDREIAYYERVAELERLKRDQGITE